MIKQHLSSPRLDDGGPFPTLYYLTHPAAVAVMSELEATQVMAESYELLAADEGMRDHYRRADESYLADPAAFGSPAEIDDISAGGMPVRVKCLHALAAGPGVNPIGDLALERGRCPPLHCECKDPGPLGVVPE